MIPQSVVEEIAFHGTIRVRVNGPYGYASAPEWSHYDTIIMVAGGIGVGIYPSRPYMA